MNQFVFRFLFVALPLFSGVLLHLVNFGSLGRLVNLFWGSIYGLGYFFTGYIFGGLHSRPALILGGLVWPIIICVLLLLTGVGLGYFANPKGWFLLILGVYFLMNIAYSFGLKNIAILDMLIVASGFVLRVKGGAIITNVESTAWLIIMTFLLALFMAIGKRRDDLLLQDSSGNAMRKSLSGYNLSFLDTMLGLFSAIIIVAYINYTVAEDTIIRLGTYRLYYSSLFVIAGIMRYLQVVFVKKQSGSPTDILFKDRFIQITIVLWIACIYVLLYLPRAPIFNQ